MGSSPDGSACSLITARTGQASSRRCSVWPASWMGGPEPSYCGARGPLTGQALLGPCASLTVPGLVSWPGYPGLVSWPGYPVRTCRSASPMSSPESQTGRQWRWVTRTREAPQSPRAAQLKPRLVRHRSRAGSVPGAAVEDQHRLDGRRHVGSPRGIDTAAICACSGLKFVPEQPGAEVPADCPGDVDGVSGYRLP